MKRFYYAACLLLVMLTACTDDEKKTVVCWGDSLTSPHHGKNLRGKMKHLANGAEDYPEFLQEMLGDGYDVVNAGVGGESSLTIMGRQGAYPMVLAHDVTIFKSSETQGKTVLGSNDMPAFLSSYNHQPVSPLMQCGWGESSPAHVNPCLIDGREYTLSAESKIWREEGDYKAEYTYYIQPVQPVDSTYTLKAGTLIETAAMRGLRGQYANIFLLGANGTFADVADLISQLKAMISYSGTDRYVVLSLHKPRHIVTSIDRLEQLEDSMSQAFGNHYINLRKYMVEHGLSDAGLTPTTADNDSIACGKIPPQLFTDGLHFTTTGYQLLASLIYRKFQELGY